MRHEQAALRVEVNPPHIGGTWQTSALCLQGLSLVRRNGEYHHFDVLGTAGVVTDAGGAVISSDLFDAFGVLRHAQGQAATPWRWQGRKLAEEGLLAACGGGQYLPTRALAVQAKKEKPERPWWHWPPRWPWTRPKPKKPPKPHWPYTGGFECAPSWLERFGGRIPILGPIATREGYCRRCLMECQHYCNREYELHSGRNKHCFDECDARTLLCYGSRLF